jgi:hypothetical protein
VAKLDSALVALGTTRVPGGTTVLLMAGLARFAESRFKAVNMIGIGMNGGLSH